MESLDLSAGPERDPYTASGIARVQALVENKNLPSTDLLLRGEFKDLTFSERYDLSRLFFRFLIEGRHKERLVEVIEGPLRRLGGGSDFAKRLEKVFKKSFGRVTLKKLDKEFRKYVSSLRPEWNESLRSLETQEDPWRQMAFTEVNAVAWRTERVWISD